MSYYVELNSKISDTLKKAEINLQKVIELNKNKVIPISILERACKINLEKKFFNVNSQYLWICLDKCYIHRKFRNGWKRFKVSFPNAYIQNCDKNRNIILKAYNLCSRPKTKTFSALCERSYVSITDYISGKVKIPLTVFLKSCQLLEKNPWKELDNCKIYSGSSISSKSIIFKDRWTPELQILLNWIKLEGNLNISRPTISISQNINEKICLEKLTRYFIEVFSLPKESIRIDHIKTRPNISILNINSAPLRQILNLRYQIALGYKSRDIEPDTFFCSNKEDFLKILASEIETEGSFARHMKKNITHCELSFSTYSKKYSISVLNKLKKLNYPSNFLISKRKRLGVKEIEYRTGFLGVNELQRFAFEIMPYFHHIKKIRNLIEVIAQENFLKICGINSNNKIKELIYEAKNKCGSFKLLANSLNKEGITISHKGVEGWIYLSNNPSVYAILKMCSIIKEDNYFKYIPKEFALSLWLQGFINREEAEKIRGIKDAYKHISLQFPRDTDRLTP